MARSGPQVLLLHGSFLMSHLFSPLKVKGITLRNRIGVAPIAVNGVAQAWHMTQLGSKAVGGAGLIIIEATAVSAEGRITPSCMSLWNDDQVASVFYWPLRLDYGLY